MLLIILLRLRLRLLLQQLLQKTMTSSRRCQKKRLQLIAQVVTS
jgi:hypothetical protein